MSVEPQGGVAVITDAARIPLSRCAEWLDLTATLCRSPCPAFPRAELADQLAESFGCSVCWHWIDADGSSGFELLAPWGLDQQLWIPYHVGNDSTRSFVLAQTGDEFSDEQLELARFVQPLIAVLDRQFSTLTRAGHDVDDLDLTGREVAVLQLLREGLTAAAIGHRLMISPRTVHAHLRSIYRKLGVADRMRAVLVSQELGLLPLASG